jgi:hypothetical protein
MKTLKSAFAGIFFLGTISLHAQTADEVASKHIAAIGGKEVIGNIKSLVIEADMAVMGSSLPSKMTVLVGKGYKSEANFNGQDIVQVITPTGGWMINPLAGSTDAQPLPEDQVKAAQATLWVGRELLDYQEKGNKLTLEGNQNVEGVNAIKLKMVSNDGKETLYFIDPATYYIVKQESTASVAGQTVTSVSTFSDHKKTDFGYVIPYSTVRNQGFEITVNVTKVEFNKEIDPKIFEMPK